MKATASVRASVWERRLPWALPVLLLAGLILRLIFIPNQGFRTDIVTFEAWTIALVDHGFGYFYAHIKFADYPPGYFYILGAVGEVWNALFRAHDGGLAILAAMVKLPAILADLGVGWLVYAIGCRFGNRALALGAAAIFILNPAMIFDSAVWGQVDSIPGGLALLAVYFLLKSDDGPAERPSWWIVAGWLAMVYSLLIKPQAAVVIPLLIAFVFTDRARMRARLIATAWGIGLGFVLVYLLALPFYPGNPLAVFSWLLHQYAFGSSQYPNNSTNAFNLWAIKGKLWQPDSIPILGIANWLWGLLLVGAALVLIVWRYLQDRTPRALLEACTIALLAFFMLATRMHERYVFDGVLFAIACVPIAGRYLWGSIVLSAVLFANLIYALRYLHVVQGSVPGADPFNVWGFWTQLLAFVAVATFFTLGYLFLGNDSAVGPAKEVKAGAKPNRGLPNASNGASPFRAFHWFDPREGLKAMRMPLDYAIMVVLGIGNFILSFVGYWRPNGSSCWAEAGLARCGIFDETYFARAGEEYLQNLRIYENTHPPLSKLLITFSMMLFGGMPKGHGLGGWTFLNGMIGHMSNGDNPYGWRFLDVVFGALVVMLLYVFAKRITGSTFFSAVAALLLTFDGMHFVQSRIATPEGFVVFFSLLASYAFYRFWIASQTNERYHVKVPSQFFAIAAGASIVAGLIVTLLWKLLWHDLNTASMVITTLYLALGFYLLARYVAFTRLFADGKRESTFGEGSYALTDGKAKVLYTADGGVLDSQVKNPQRGQISQARGGDLVYDTGGLKIAYRRDATVEYQTPVGSATYANNQTRADNGTENGSSARLWLILFTVALGLLVSSKWYGVMGFGVSFFVLIGIWSQRKFLAGRPSQWGNPRGFRLDGALVSILFVAVSVYLAAWAPDLIRHGQDDIQNFNDVVYRQYTMFEYHDHLVATHPYSSKWWEWPIDYVPIAYYYQDHRVNQQDPKACCVVEITSMPNPLNMWFGLLCVPLVGFLAWRERNKGYALIVVSYLFQWLPWMKSPRITFAYHFYDNIPLICLCNAIVLQRVWQWGCKCGGSTRIWAGVAVGAYVLIIAGAFVFFYPILAASPLSWTAWNARMWFPKWIVGPG